MLPYFFCFICLKLVFLWWKADPVFIRLDPGFRKNLDKKLNTLLDSMGIP
jgi:hypothetical protein